MIDSYHGWLGSQRSLRLGSLVDGAGKSEGVGFLGSGGCDSRVTDKLISSVLSLIMTVLLGFGSDGCVSCWRSRWRVKSYLHYGLTEDGLRSGCFRAGYGAQQLIVFVYGYY
jgi:hypothetical protein